METECPECFGTGKMVSGGEIFEQQYCYMCGGVGMLYSLDIQPVKTRVPETDQNEWDFRWLELTRAFAQFSKDPSTKVGAVIVNDKNRMVGHGYNGFPRGIYDDPGLLSNREEKLLRTIHAEHNAILNAESPVEGATLYTWPLPPCMACALVIIQKDIHRVVSPSEYSEKWKDSVAKADALFKEANIEIYRMWRTSWE
jgi:dCMP deaminase